MYRVFIVDDESNIARGLEKIIDWNALECDTYIYFNSINAYQAALIENPQILITDIKMPHMNGLELIQKLKSANIRFETIILSGYSDFEYARNGIDLGVSKYILKPVEQEELKSTIPQTILRYENSIIAENAEKTRKIKIEKIYDPYEGNCVIEKITKYIDTHFTQNITLSDLSERFFLNPSYLSQLFKIKSGETYIQYLTGKRIEKARELLLSNMKVCDVCHSVGYEDVKHFSRTFERIVGTKPSLYKPV